MPFDDVEITSTRNGSGATIGFRDDLIAGDAMVFSLTSMVGVTEVEWNIVGRPEGSAVGGTVVPSELGTGSSAAFGVDADVGNFSLDGSYKVEAIINPGAPSETRKTVVAARLAGLTVLGPADTDVPLRRLAGFESLEDTSVGTMVQGWALQANRWFSLLRRAFRRVTRTSTINTSVTSRDDLVKMDSTGAVRTATLPSGTLNPGMVVTIKRINGGGNAVTVAAVAGTVEVTSLTAQNMARTYQSDGTNWVVVSGYL